MIASQEGCTVERPSRDDGRADVYLGDGRGYQRLLDQYGIDRVSLADQIAETAEYLKRTSPLDVLQDSHA